MYMPSVGLLSRPISRRLLPLTPADAVLTAAGRAAPAAGWGGRCAMTAVQQCVSLSFTYQGRHSTPELDYATRPHIWNIKRRNLATGRQLDRG